MPFRRPVLGPVLSIAAAVTLLVAGCSSGTSADGDADGTLVIAVDAEPSNLNPIFGDVYGTVYGDHYPMFSGLLDYGKNLEPEPDLAAAPPERSADGRTVTVQVRTDAKWHDGKPVTAEDVEFTYRSIMDPEVGTNLRALWFDSLEKVEATGPETVRFTLKRADPAFFGKLTTGIVPKHLLDGQDLNKAQFNMKPVGSGPFVFQELREGERMVLTANADYHGDKPGIERLVYRFVGDAASRVRLLESGDVDVDAAGLSPRAAAPFRDKDGYEVVTIPGDMLTLTMPVNNPLFEDAEVRRAIGMAIDRKKLVEGLESGEGRAVNSPFFPGHWAHTDKPAAHDPDAAEKVLADAGWTPGDDGVLTRDGDRFAFDLIYGHGNVEDNAALAIRDMLKAIGVQVEPTALEFDDQQRRVAEGAATLQGIGNAYDPALDLFNTYHSSLADDDPGTNPARVDDPDIDAAIEAGRNSLDTQTRTRAYHELQDLLEEQGSWQYLLQNFNNYVVPAGIGGVDPQPREGHNHGFSRGLLWNTPGWTPQSS